MVALGPKSYEVWARERTTPGKTGTRREKPSRALRPCMAKGGGSAPGSLGTKHRGTWRSTQWVIAKNN